MVWCITNLLSNYLPIILSFPNPSDRPCLQTLSILLHLDPIICTVLKNFNLGEVTNFK